MYEMWFGGVRNISESAPEGQCSLVRITAENLPHLLHYAPVLTKWQSTASFKLPSSTRQQGLFSLL